MTNPPDPDKAPPVLQYARPLGRAPWRIWLARGVAVVADIVELALIPAGSAAGGFNPVVDAVDVATAILLTLLVGWHLAFIPSILIKVLPVADLAPTWTIAIAIATWPKKSPPPIK